MRGGMEAVYDNVPIPIGFGQFAPLQPARGPMFLARNRAKLAGAPPSAVVLETEFYGWRQPLCFRGDRAEKQDLVRIW